MLKQYTETMLVSVPYKEKRGCLIRFSSVMRKFSPTHTTYHV